MKVKIVCDKHHTEVLIESSDDCAESIIFATEELYELVANQTHLLSDTILPETATTSLKESTFKVGQKKDTTPTKLKDNHDTFNIRERIPNNVVDIEDLDVQQAIRQNALVRCPECGQAHCLVVKDKSLYLMRRNYDNNEFEIVAIGEEKDLPDMVCKDDSKLLEYFNTLQDAPCIDSSDFAVDNETEMFCPICNKSNTFMMWKDACENPLHYFESEDLCDVCGGEVSSTVTKDNSNGKCCNKCGRRE